MLKLIPARGGVRHTFANGSVIKIKRGSAEVGEIRIESAPRGNRAVLYAPTGDIIRSRENTFALTSHNIRSQFWGETYGCALHLVVPEPVAAPEVIQTPVDDKTKVIDEFDAEGEYIVWCPASSLPPRVVLNGRKQAKAVAMSMAQRHGKKFHWCRLMGSAESVTSIKVEE
ncbi:hypothetical protein PQC34_gp043 [Cronobacter phage A24]|uniref:Uncharacterized protein n=1 Tax=Cronobacter phage A24 TaxID=2795745 RepID=A0A7T5QXY2_9CAUD|nr:hypothetical protein PQC34_gp043 [Cronobacter phage A24]QQG33691.1 hypothetical protein [Cronobacter phage A24]